MDWNNYFSTVSKSDTGREQITYIPLNLLDSDDQNFYSLSEIPALADNIATVGLQQPLRVRKHPTAEGRFMVVSGHRRRAALEELSKEDPERWAEVACIIQADEVSPALQQLQLIYANSGTRKLSSADMSEQAVQVEKLLYQLQEEGHEFPGRMREHVAQVMQTTQTKLATLKRIRERLHEVWQPLYKDGTIKESAAYELSGMNPADQKLIYDVLRQLKRDLRWEYADDFKTYAARMKDVCTGECAACDKDARDIAVCQKRCRAVSAHRSVEFQCGRCCSECDDLGTCKYACPAFSDKINAIKAQKKENAQRLKAEQEERERPTIELLKLLWQRFGEARRASGYSVADVYSAINKYYSSDSDQKVAALEDGSGVFSVYSTAVPGAEQYDLTYAKRLRGMADLFGCTTDFLLGRTDSRVSSGSPEISESLPCSWFPVSVEPPVGTSLILIDSGGYVDTGKYKGCGEFTMDFGDPVVLWSYFPDEDAAQEYPSVIWATGNPDTPGNYAAYVQIDGAAKPMLRELYWNGLWWEMFKTRIDSNVAVVRWTAQPDF